MSDNDSIDSIDTTLTYDINEIDTRDRCCKKCKNYKPYTEYLRQEKRTFNKYCMRCRKQKQVSVKINKDKEQYILNYMNCNEDNGILIQDDISYMKQKLTNIYNINNQDKRKDIIENIITKLIKGKYYNNYVKVDNICFMDNNLNEYFKPKQEQYQTIHFL